MLVWEADDGSIDGKLFQNLYQACRALARACGKEFRNKFEVQNFRQVIKDE